jgi:hypothetical protein
VVNAELYGPYVDVNNTAGADAHLTGIATPGEPFSLRFDDGSARRDERDVFDAVNDIHDFIARFDAEFSYINQRIIANVNINSSCGAHWDGELHFFREGFGCANTGEIQGIVAHEYCHGIQDFILGWQGGDGLGEGNADVLANLMTQESILARGFFLGDCETGIRDSDNGLQYPGDLTGQPHNDGLIIAGFHWDSMTELQDALGEEQGTLIAGERWHFGRVLLLPEDQPTQVLATFIADDDDGDLSNGTPHYTFFCIGAENHGFDCPEIDWPVDVGINQPVVSVPSAHFLATATPNPFNPQTSLRYGLSQTSRVSLEIFDPGGRLVRTLIRTTQPAGSYTVIWDGKNDTGQGVAPGVYYARLHAGEFVATEKLMVLR